MTKLDFTKSHALMNKAQRIMPGGVSSPVRSFSAVGGSAFVAGHGDEAYLFDVDGNKYIDMVGSWGPLIHGHNHPDIISAVESALQSGASFGVTCQNEIELCQKIVDWVPSVDMVRLVNSGTEACMSAVRLARAYSKRDLILKFEGNYHGHADSFLVAAGSGLATLGTSASAGVPEKSVTDTIVVPFNDLAAIEAAFDKHSSKIAGVILEVVCGNSGVIRPDIEFLQTLRRLCDEQGSLLIFDEVMTGFRLSKSGAQGIYNIEPDLSCFGKVIGGGLPVGAYGGREEIMKLVAPLGPMYQAGTLSGNPLGAAAGLASLDLIEKGGDLFYQRLDSVCHDYATRIQAHIDYKSYPVSIEYQGSMITLFFRANKPVNFSQAKECDLEAFKKFFWAMLERGVYFPPSQFEACFLSIMHEPELMSEVADKTIDSLDFVFGEQS